MKRLTLPGVLPSINHMYKNAVVKGRLIRVLTKEAQGWANDIIIQTNAWRNKQRWKTTPKKTKVVVRLWFYFPDLRLRDTHNTLKLLLDCFEDAEIYENDQYALPQIMDWEVDRENPRVEIEFEIKGA